ncbi:MAG: metal-dependent hydrolase [Chromatiales bacterium]|nr:metal-dependent hydrolase [Chromatiales bacterium]
MDLISHALAGALVAGAASPAPRPKGLLLAGALAALMPDLDVLIRADGDPLLTLEYHRHFSHSLLLVPLLGLFASLIYRRVARPALGLTRVWLALSLAVLSADLLDWCTSYGVHLLWPMQEQRLALNIIAVVDPAMTLLLALGLWGLLAAGQRAAWIGLVAGMTYLSIASAQQVRGEAAARAWAAGEGVPVQRLLVKPTLGNILLWRAIVDDGARYHPLALRIGMDTTDVRSGAAIAHWQAHAEPLPESLQLALTRFERLSDGWLVRHPLDAAVVGDIRYAMLPDSNQPLWGLRLPEAGSGPVELVEFRDGSKAVREAFLDQLLGRAAVASVTRAD